MEWLKSIDETPETVAKEARRFQKFFEKFEQTLCDYYQSAELFCGEKTWFRVEPDTGYIGDRKVPSKKYLFVFVKTLEKNPPIEFYHYYSGDAPRCIIGSYEVEVKQGGEFGHQCGSIYVGTYGDKCQKRITYGWSSEPLLTEFNYVEAVKLIDDTVKWMSIYQTFKDLLK